MLKKRYVRIGGLTVLALAVLTMLMTNSYAQKEPSPALPEGNEKALIDAVRAGKGRRLPPSPADTVYMGIWRNCRFIIIPQHSTHYVVDGVEVVMGDTTDADMARMLPARDPTCDGVEPTRSQIEAMQAEVGALNAQNRPAGAPPPPPLPPLR